MTIISIAQSIRALISHSSHPALHYLLRGRWICLPIEQRHLEDNIRQWIYWHFNISTGRCPKPYGSINLLREESKKKQISLNTLINQIIREHLDWHTFAAPAGLFYIPRSTMSVVLSKLTEEEISELAIIIAKRDIDIGLLLRGEFTLILFEHSRKLVTNIFFRL